MKFIISNSKSEKQHLLLHSMGWASVSLPTLCRGLLPTAPLCLRLDSHEHFNLRLDVLDHVVRLDPAAQWSPLLSSFLLRRLEAVQHATLSLAMCCMPERICCIAASIGMFAWLRPRLRHHEYFKPRLLDPNIASPHNHRGSQPESTRKVSKKTHWD